MVAGTQGEATIALVTVCHGRRAHLERSLPRMCAQPGASTLVVDYACPEGTGEWVRSRAGAGVQLVEVSGARWNRGRARNLGVAAATTDWVALVDADVLLPPDFVARLRAVLRPGAFFVAVPRNHPGPSGPRNAGSTGEWAATWDDDRDLYGLLACRRADFRSVGGFDEALEGWGGEDTDLRRRLNLIGRVERALGPLPGLCAIPHDDRLRVAHEPVPCKRLSAFVNHLYVDIKLRLARRRGRFFTARECRDLYAAIRRLVLEVARSGQERSVEVPVAGAGGVETSGAGRGRARVALARADLPFGDDDVDALGRWLAASEPLARGGRDQPAEARAASSDASVRSM